MSVTELINCLPSFRDKKVSNLMSSTQYYGDSYDSYNHHGVLVTQDGSYRFNYVKCSFYKRMKNIFKISARIENLNLRSKKFSSYTTLASALLPKRNIAASSQFGNVVFTILSKLYWSDERPVRLRAPPPPRG